MALKSKPHAAPSALATPLALADTRAATPAEPAGAAPDSGEGVPWARSDAVVGLPDDAGYRLAREQDEQYVRGLGRLAVICAAAYPLFGAAEVIALLGGIGPRHLLPWIVGTRLGLGALLFAAGSLLLLRPLRPALVRALDLGLQLVTAAHLGWLAAISAQTGEAIYLTALGMQFFLRCLFVPGSPRLAAAVSTAAWPTTMASFFLFAPSPLPLRGAALWSWLAATQLMLLACWSIALIGGGLVSGLRQREVEARSKGRYRVKGRLGSGGFGAVYQGWDAFLEAPCAIKVLHRQGDYPPELVRRFETEVRATSRLTSPHVVRVYDYGCTRDGRLYYVMELLEGQDLCDLVNEAGPLELRRALSLFTQAAEGLAAAHGAGTLHRDIKPANLFVLGREPAEQLKVLDFGLARSLTEGADLRSAAGTLVGTPGFIAPEHVKGERGDERADVYALGAVMYFALTGQEVFDGATPMAVLARHLFEVPRPPRDLRPELPAALEALLLRCLEKAPERRFPSMAALRAALVEAGA